MVGIPIGEVGIQEGKTADTRLADIIADTNRHAVRLTFKIVPQLTTNQPVEKYESDH
jgi:hypothetical protein